MKRLILAVAILAAPTVAPAAEVLFTNGPQEYQGRSYYWLAEWKLEIALPQDVAPTDTFEVFFGSKGPGKRTLYYEFGDQRGSVAEVRQTPYEWIPLPLTKLSAEKKVVLFGKGRSQVAFLAGLRLVGKSTGKLEVKPVRVAGISIDGKHAAVWSEMPGFEMNDDVRQLWDPAPQKPDWARAERSGSICGNRLEQSPTLAPRSLPPRPR